MKGRGKNATVNIFEMPTKMIATYRLFSKTILQLLGATHEESSYINNDKTFNFSSQLSTLHFRESGLFQHSVTTGAGLS